ASRQRTCPRSSEDDGRPPNDLVDIGGSSFGIMAVIVAVERGWIDRAPALGRLHGMLDFLESSPRYHGMFPHFTNGHTRPAELGRAARPGAVHAALQHRRAGTQRARNVG